jgi:hypothetical protein
MHNKGKNRRRRCKGKVWAGKARTGRGKKGDTLGGGAATGDAIQGSSSPGASGTGARGEAAVQGRTQRWCAVAGTCGEARAGHTRRKA